MLESWDFGGCAGQGNLYILAIAMIGDSEIKMLAGSTSDFNTK